jgi:UDP:flavonoid glycosyltransferase YjiC (YdhE family)
VLITQGTFEKDSSKLLEPAIDALKESNCLVVVTTGGFGREALIRKYSAPNIIIEDFIPFDEVLPYTDVYISNGGYGGVLLAIQNGVPMVVAGIHEGKSEINARVHYFGLGINLKTERPKPGKIRAAVEKILNQDSYRQRVKEMSREFMQYKPQALTALYVRELLLKNSLTINHKNNQHEKKSNSTAAAGSDYRI